MCENADVATVRNRIKIKDKVRDKARVRNRVRRCLNE